MTPYHSREITSLLHKALSDMPVVVLTGMRQSGKSTLLQREAAFKKRRYISLDDFATLTSAQKDPETLLEGEEPLTIDEAQRAPQLLSVIKRAVDRSRKPGQFLVSGSANFSLLKEVSESLAGRALYLTLYPMTRREISQTIDKKPALLQFLEKNRWPKTETRLITPTDIFHGGMPSVCLGEVKDPSLWFRGYEQTYLERDVRAISQVADLITFRNLLHLAALRTGQVLNQSELGRDAKLNATTVSRYLSLFETSFLMLRLPPYLLNRSTRLIKSPKLYVSDSGLAAHLSGVHSSKRLMTEPLFGALLETYVVQDLLSLCTIQWPDARIYFWNVQGRHEVDVVLEVDHKLLAIEVKGANRWQEKDLTGLRAFLKQTRHCQAGILAYNGTEAVSLGNRLWAVPIDLLLS